jgi:pimeloyl-ACP methyl ester carboxylesterase
MTPLVLLHAFPLNAEMYAPVVELFDGGLFTPNLPGFGGTDVPAQEPSLDVYADRVAAQLDEAHLDRVVVGGTSMGGYTAMAFCRRHRERVAGLALIDTKASADAQAAAAGRRAMAQLIRDTGSTEPLLENVYPKLLGTTTFSQRVDIASSVRASVSAAPPAAAAWAQLAMAERPDSLPTLAAVNVPSLVVVGVEDVLSPPSDADEMADVLPDGELVVIANAGHLTPLEAPTEVVSALQRLMHRVDG